MHDPHENEGEVRELNSDQTFENLEVWQDAIELGAAVYGALKTCSDHGFRKQMQNAATSVSSNIAEGYERDSNQEFVRFLIIAKGSCGEVRSQGYLARRVGLLSESSARPSSNRRDGCRNASHA